MNKVGLIQLEDAFVVTVQILWTILYDPLVAVDAQKLDQPETDYITAVFQSEKLIGFIFELKILLDKY